MIGSHTVDGAGNAGKSVDVLNWNTKGERSTKIVTSKCDSHQVNTTGKRASGTSAHKVNLNPELGSSLTLLHTTLVRMCMSGKCMGVYDNVRKENHRTSSPALDSAVKTRWNSDHKETERASANQRDIATSLDQMLSKNGIDSDLFKSHQNDLSKIKPTDDDWDIYQQYESGVQPLKQYSEFSQSAKVIFHMELFEGKMAMERLGVDWFPMFENLSQTCGDAGRGCDLRKRLLSQLVAKTGFELEDAQLKNRYKKDHIMLESIKRCRRVAVRNLALRLLFMKGTLAIIAIKIVLIEISQNP